MSYRESMSLLIATQSYKNDTPTPFGLLLELCLSKGKIIRQLKINTPVESEEGGRLKPGLRGLFRFKSKIYTCSWNSVFIVDQESFCVEKTISHKWMSDLHGLYVDESGIWVTSSYPDAVILYDFQGHPIASLWFPETHLYKYPAKVDREMDWSKKGKHFRGFREFHANHVEVNGNYVYVTGRGEKLNNGKIVYFPKDSFISEGKVSDFDLRVYCSSLYGPHDGIWQDTNIWVTETNKSTIAIIDKNRKVSFRKKVISKEGEKIEYEGIMDFVKTTYKRLKGKPVKRTHWTRGLCITENSVFVGQSVLAGSNSLARVVEICKSSLKVRDCINLDIADYPETRIFQLIKN